MKRFISVFLCIITILLCLCSCAKEKIYLPATLKCYGENGLAYTVIYTYDNDGRILREAGTYETESLRNYSDVYTYNNKGELTSLAKTELGEETVYTAEKITKYKYLLTAEDNRTITVIFDDKGHVVSFKTSDGYLLEYAYTYSKSGKPTSIKKQIVNPSGSHKLFEYNVTFTDNDSYEYYDIADNSYHFEVDCLVKTK